MTLILVFENVQKHAYSMLLTGCGVSPMVVNVRVDQ